MLVISGQIGQQIHIGDSVTLTVVGIQNGRVTLAVSAPTSSEIRHTRPNPEEEKRERA